MDTGNAAVDPRLILAGSVAADTAVVSAVKAAHPEVTVGMHIRRGGYRSAYLARGGYEPVAGNALTVDEEKPKLELVVDTAESLELGARRHERPPAARARAEGSRARPR